MEYWNPLVFATLDSMHNLFLGDLQNHVRSVWGVDAVKSTDDKVQKNQKPHSEEEQRGELEKVLQALSRGNSKVAVRKGYVVAIAQVNNVKIDECVTKNNYWQALRDWVRSTYSLSFLIVRLTFPISSGIRRLASPDFHSRI